MKFNGSPVGNGRKTKSKPHFPQAKWFAKFEEFLKERLDVMPVWEEEFGWALVYDCATSKAVLAYHHKRRQVRFTRSTKPAETWEEVVEILRRLGVKQTEGKIE